MKQRRYIEISQILLIPIFFLLFLYIYFYNSLFLYLSIVLLIFGITLFILYLSKNLLQNYKDKKFREKFLKKRLFPLGGIYWNFNWNKMKSSFKELSNNNQKLPYFLLNFAKRDNFNISLWEFKSKFKSDNFQRLPRLYFYSFFIKDFKYTIKSFDYQHIKNKDISFSIVIIAVEQFSFVFFIVDKDFDFDLYQENGVFFPKYYTSKFPIIPNSFFNHLNDIGAEWCAFNPFGFINFGSITNSDEIDDIKKEYGNIFLFKNDLKKKIISNEWFNISSPSFMLLKIQGERTFFDCLFREIIFWQNNPFLNLKGWMPESNIFQFIDFFDYFKHYIDELSVDQFKKLEDYFTICQYSLKKTLNVYNAFISFLKLDERSNYLLTNILNGLNVIQNNLAIITSRIKYGELKPNKNNFNGNKELIMSKIEEKFPNCHFELNYQLNKLNFWTKYTELPPSGILWLKIIRKLFGLLRVSSKDGKIFREQAQNWKNEPNDMAPWTNKWLEEKFGVKHYIQSRISDGHSDHFIDDIALEDKLLRTNEDLNDTKIIEEKYEKEKRQIIREGILCGFQILIIADIRYEIKDNKIVAKRVPECFKIFYEDGYWTAAFLFQAFTEPPSNLK